MATALPPPGAGGTPTATIGVNLQALISAPAAARTAAQATAREIEKAFRESQRAQAALDKQRIAELQASLTQRRVAVRAAAREETEAQRLAQREQAALDKQRTAELKAALQQRRVAVRAAAREEAEAQRAAAAQQRGIATLAGAFGIGLGAAGVIQAGRQLTEAAQLATAYERQNVAALHLAGSQAKLNSLLAAYDVATGGAIDKAQSLADVTRLQAVGFAKSAPELERFVRAARGAALAMGKSQEDITQEVQLAISNQSIRRLDQIGLGVTEVNDRIAELRAQNQGMTREAAFQEAILSLLTEKYGELTRSTAAQASQLEKATKAWKDLRLEIGQGGIGDVLGFLSLAFAEHFRGMAGQVDFVTRSVRELATAMGLIPIDRSFQIGVGVYQRNQAISPQPRPGGGTLRTEEQTALIRERFEGLQRIESEAAKSRLSETQSYEEQRANILRNYGKSTAREAEDFARQRLGQERKLNLAILDVAADSARQRAKWEADLARTIAEQRTDSAEKVAELRADANEKLAELDKDYYRDRERAAGDHRDKLLDAAARLDATAVLEEQRRYARERREAEEAHKEQRDETTKDLDKRVAEEQASLDKSIRQAQEAHQRQLDEQAENDRLRIDELKASFEEQRRQEDEERAIRLGRQAEDHQDQLGELARAHTLRLQQINEQAGEERKQFEEQSEAALAEQGIQTERWIESNRKLTDAAMKDFDRWFKHVNETFSGTGAASVVIPDRPTLSRASGGPIPRTGPVLAHAGEYVLNAPTTRALGGMMGGFDQASLLAAVRGGGRSVTWTGDMHLAIPGGTSASAQELAAAFEPLLMASLAKIASQ